MIYSVLDDTEHATLMEVTENVNKRYGKDWRLQTVATFLNRMKEKGYIEVYRIGRYSHYVPLLTHDEMLVVELNNINKVYFNGRTDKFKMYLERFIYNVKEK